MRLFTSILLFLALIMQTTTKSEDLPKVDYNTMEDIMPLRKDILKGKFDNGLEYFILKNDKPENRVSLRLAVKIGAVDETDSEQGMAHFVEHMCFNGTEDFPKSELVNFLEKSGVKFGAHLNAQTGFDETIYMLELPSDDVKILETGIKILENWAHKVTFADNEIDDERGVIVEEGRLRGGVQMRTFEKHKEVAFYNSKYKNRLPIGDTTLLRKAPHEDFRAFYKKWYRPDLMSVIVVGDIDVDKMEKYVKEYFSNIPIPEKTPTPALYNLPENKQPLYSVISDKEMQFPTIGLTYRRPAEDKKGTYSEYRTTIIDQIALGAMNERLAEKSLLAVPPYQYAQAGYRTSMGATDFDLIAVGKGTEYKKATNALLSEAKRTTELGITASELERMKENILARYKQSFSEINNTKSSNLSNEIVRHFLKDEPVPGIDYEYAFVKQIMPKITLEEVNQRLGTYIDDNNYIATVSLPASTEEEPTKEVFQKNYEEVFGTKVVAYNEKKIDEPLFDKTLTPGKIVKKDKLPYDVYKLELSNGSTVYFKNTDFKDDEIIFNAISKGGTSLMGDNQFVSGRFADNIVVSSGISNFDITTLKKLTSSKQYSISPYISNLSEGFSGSSNTQDFEEMLQLLHLYFTNPRIDKEAYESWLAKQKDFVINSKRNPVSLFRDSISYILSSYHERSKPIEEDYFNDVDMNKAFLTYKERFANAGDFDFIFTGNIDNVNFEELVALYIGSLPSTGKKENWKDLGIKVPKGTINKEFKKGIDKNSKVLMLYTNDNFDYTPENIHNLKSLDQVLGIRLREQLREEKGGVYNVSVSSNYDKYPTPHCSVVINFGCDPNRVEELSKDTRMIVEEIKNSLISDENMLKIKETQRRELELALKDNGTWSSWIYNSIWLNESLQNIGNKSTIINDMTKVDVKGAANKYLDNNNLKKFVLSPEESN